MEFLAWYDDAPKVDVATKIAEGAAAFTQRTGRVADTILCHELTLEEAQAAAPDAQVRRSDSISNANTFYFGCEGAVVIASRPPSDAPRTSGEPRGKTRR
jgi:hypothetical protein